MGVLSMGSGWNFYTVAIILQTVGTVDMLDAIHVSIAVGITPGGVNEIEFYENDDCAAGALIRALSHAVAGGAACQTNAEAAASASSRIFGTETVVAIAGISLFGAFCQMTITESCEKCDVVLKRVDKNLTKKIALSSFVSTRKFFSLVPLARSAMKM
jgi:hypothetical protein